MNTRYWDLIAKYFSKDASNEEQKELMDWIKQHPENEKVFKQAEKIWNTMKKEERNPNVEMTWETFKDKMLADSSEAKVVSMKTHNTKWWLAAASVILVVGLGFLLIRQAGYETIETSDNMEVFYLPDSSLIWLNKNSKMEYPKEFGNERIVYLEGEAFFEVKRDTLKPFIINTKNTTTKVLGTSFNLKAYEKEKDVQLVVATGKVAFSSKEEENNKVILQKGEKAIISENSNEVKKQKNDDPNFMSWKNNKEEIKKTKKYKHEISSPSVYLYTEFKWKENIVKQTIIEGKLYSSAIFTTYKNIKLRASYYGKGGKKIGEETFTLNKIVYPGLYVPYKYKLNNWLEDTREVKVEILDAKTIE